MINSITKFFIFILGASIGSFLNVLIDRLPRNESINGRSHCDHCKKKIVWYDMFPVLSFFILGGKTRCCGKKMSWQYPVIEILTGLVFVLVFKDGPYGTNIIRSVLNAGIISCFIVIFISDLKYHLISDYILLALFIFSLPAVALAKEGQLLTIFTISLISGLIVALPIFLIYYFSKERAMGLGDVYLSAIMGFLLGWQKGFLALYIAFVTGAIVGVLLILLHRKKIKSKIAFGPFLVLGTTIMLLYGNKVLEWIKRVYGF